MRKNKKTASRILWAAVIIWMVIIFLFSAQNGQESSALSGGISEKIIDIIDPLIVKLNWDSAKFAAGFESALRTMAHGAIYFVLGVLLSLTMQCYNISMLKRFLLSLSISVVYAISDEIHQHFVPGRACQLFDVMVDTLGALVGILLVVAVFYKKYKKKKVKA